ncbi:hypothetical protein [Deinococcus sp. RM]|uniref:hypothetical protein n=1 Tax=Deinococcus sp. RM TaxID=2316359 RepID=UPI0011C2105A|nr:hypothetical protein [Deinococcus sp. RM]
MRRLTLPLLVGVTVALTAAVVLLVPSRRRVCDRVGVEVSVPRLALGHHAAVTVLITNPGDRGAMVSVDGCAFGNRTARFTRLSDQREMPDIPSEYGCYEGTGNQNVAAHGTARYSGTLLVGHLQPGHYRAVLKFPDRTTFSDESWLSAVAFTANQLLAEVPVEF